MIPELPATALRYGELLLEENRRQNLVSRELSREEVFARLLLPCWRFAELPAVVAARQVLDIGSGGGLPGILVALQQPQRRVHLVDASLKKCRFLESLKGDLDLPELRVHHGRVEKLHLDPLPDLLCARFVADLPRLEAWTRRLRQPGCRLLVFKGSQETAPGSLHDLRLVQRIPIEEDKDVWDYVSETL
jgi:16S rRNA (guanine527-N7)-methyltransferase